MNYRLAIAIIMFIFVFVVMALLTKIKHSYKLKYNVKFYMKIVFIACGFALLISILNPNNLANILVYFLLLVLLPYIITVNDKAKHDENTFNDIVLYCQGMANSLRQDGNVYNALATASKEVNSVLSADIQKVMRSLSEGKEDTQEKLKMMELKYPFTIIKQLNIMIYTLYYETSENTDKIIELFQYDEEQLVNSVKANQSKRKVLRSQYIGLSLGCLLAMRVLVKELTVALNIQSQDNLISNIVLTYCLIDIILLFIVDTYFNSHITKE